MDVSQALESGQAVQRLQEWIHEGSELYRRLVDQLRVLQEQVDAGRAETEHWRRQGAAAEAESERLRQDVRELQAENERLQTQQQEWDGIIGSVDEMTRRMNDMITKLRASRGKVL